MSEFQWAIAELLERARTLNAARQYPELLQLLQGQPFDDLFEEPELALLYADVLRRVGQADRSVEISERLEPFCMRRGNDRLYRGRLNVLGMARFDLGHLEQAELAWNELAAKSQLAEDEEFAARANNNLGVLLTLSDRSDEALATYARAVAAYQRLGYRRGLAQTFHNLGITYRELDFLDDADEHFRRAGEYARLDESEDEIARVEQERAIVFYLAGDASMARTSAMRALERYERLEDPTGMGEVERTLALFHLGDGALDEAVASLERALELARNSKAALLEAETLAGLSYAYRRKPEEERAAGLEREARERFSALGADAWGDKEFRRLERLVRGVSET